MELIYLWVEHYKNLNNFGVCLNSKYSENYKTNFNENNFLIHLNEIDDLQFFNKNLNLIIIAGENGTGKSNIVNLISGILRQKQDINSAFKNEYPNYDLFNFNSNYCLILKENEKFYHISKGLKNKTLKINNKKIELNAYKQTTNVAKFCSHLRIDDNDYIDLPYDSVYEVLKYRLKNYFYYDRFNPYYSFYPLENLFDKSNNLLLFEQNPNLKFEKMGIELDVLYKTTYFNDKLLNLRSKFQREFQVVFKKGALVRQVSFSLRAYKRYAKITEINKEKFINNFISDYFPIICFAQILILAMEYALKNINNIHIQRFINILQGTNKNSIDFIDYKNTHDRIKFYDFIKIMTEQKNVLLNIGNKAYDMASLAENYENNIEKEKDFIIENFDLIIKRNETSFRIKKDKMVSFDKFYYVNKKDGEIYDDKKIYIHIFDKNFYKVDEKSDETYSFKDLSTGEQRILKFFGDILLLKEYANDYTLGIKEPDTYIFDEMDLSWHPVWQQKMINYIVDIFKYDDKKNNLIFTTHSPILLSDITKNNLILLKKDKNTVLAPKDFETFGSNIHDLYRNNFFLNCTGCYTIGDFAKEKIKKIIEDLKNKKLKINYDVFEKQIKAIGEPLIKNNLLEMLYERKSNLSQNDISLIIEENKKLKEEIEKLKQKK